MEYNKEGEVTRYFNLDDITKLNLPENIINEFEQKFKKRVYYGYRGSCRIGTLCGLEVNKKLSDCFYILDESGETRYISCLNSITLL